MDKETKEETRERTAEIVRLARDQYIQNGANPKKAWEQISTRMASAARRSDSVQSWVSRFLRDLQISDPGDEISEYSVWISGNVEYQEFSRFIDDEYQYIIALARLSHQNKKKEK